MAIDKAVDSGQLNSDLTSIADAIRTKGGTSAQLAFPAGFVQAIADIPSGGGGINVDDYFTGAVPAGAVVFNQTASIAGSYAISGRANMTKLTVNAENTAYALAKHMIRNNPALLICIFNFGAGRGSREYMITECSALTTIVVRGTLNGCDQSSFRANSKMKYFDVENSVSKLGNNAFWGNTKMDTLIFRQPTIVRVTSQTFINTPFKSGGTGGTIYIPESMYNHLGDGTSLDYKAATNWSTWDGYGTITWAKIEGSPYESLTWYEV